MKILSVNLWFEKYGHKTLAQLKSFSYFKYDTYAATITEDGKQLKCEIYRVEFHDTSESDDGHNSKTTGTRELISEQCATFDRSVLGTGYFAAFRYLFDYAVNNDFDIVYFRRLMSKIAYAAPHFKNLSGHCSIVYEFPTFPFDIPANRLYALRDRLEMLIYRRSSKYISVTSCCLYQHGTPGKDWLLFENGIDISNYSVHNAPPLESDDSVINMLMIANMQSWHRSERILYALRDYKGSHRLHLIVASPDSEEYTNMQRLAKEYGVSYMIDFNGFLPISEIDRIADNCHLAVGQLSGSEYGVMETHAIKHKDYCALGLPMFSTCTDTSFPAGYPYYRFLKDTDAPIDLDGIIKWYEQLRAEHPSYRREMYEHAREKLQYNGYVQEIIKRSH